jgi:glutaryl-CoA dehydrogenase
MTGLDRRSTDFYLLDDLLTEEEKQIRDRVRAFCDREVLPVINDYWERAAFPFELLPGIAELGVVGGTIVGRGCPGMSAVAAGLVAMEWARADGSVGTFYGVHSFLAMQAIDMLGSDEQRDRWLPPMARLDTVGAFALTEPDHGSDAVRLETAVRRDGDGFVIEGTKRWIGNASIADVLVVWARGEDGNVGGYLVEKGTPGLQAEVMTGKTALRAVWQADVTLDGVRVPAGNRLAGCRSFADVSKVLDRTRYTVAWRALGVGLAAYETALDYAGRREQFGQPIASYQLVQEKLARMLAEVTGMQLLCWRLSQLADAGAMTAAMASMAKMNNAAKARAIVADARDILGGNGILLENHVARHHADMEAVFTFEGTDSVQALIVGREVTGISAIAPRVSSRRPQSPPGVGST